MSEASKSLSAEELAKLVQEFQDLETHEEQCVFYHKNPALHAVIRGAHFPKPADKTATQ